VLPLALLLLCLFLPAGVDAGADPVTLYVDALSGSDLGDGSPASPFATIGAALALALPGDAISVAPGFYAEDVAMADGVDVLGSGAAATVLDGLLACADARIEGFELREGVGCAAPARIERNWIRGQLEIATSDVEANGNLFLAPLPGAVADSSGAVYVASGVGVRITGNTFFGTYGVQLADGSQATLANNALVHGFRGIELQVGASAVLLSNDVFENRFGIIGFRSDYIGVDDPTGSDGNLSAAPDFVDQVEGDFRLRASSPLIDVGDDAEVSLASDLDGGARVLDGDGDLSAVVDIGAQEFDPAELLPLDVAIDLLPRKEPNVIKLKKLTNPNASSKKLKVTVLSQPGFSAPDEVDLATLRLGALPVFRCKIKDVDRDDADDLFCQFPLSGVSLGSWPISVPPACVRGETLAGRKLRGCDTVTIRP
jgi:hypothetical protein